MVVLQPPKGTDIQQLVDEPLTKSANTLIKDNKSELVCFTCGGRGLILCVQGVFKARMTCHTCLGEGIAKKT